MKNVLINGTKYDINKQWRLKKQDVHVISDDKLSVEEFGTILDNIYQCRLNLDFHYEIGPEYIQLLKNLSYNNKIEVNKLSLFGLPQPIPLTD